MTTQEKLDQLAELYAAAQVLDLDKQALIDSVLTPEVKAKLAEINAEYADHIDTVNGKINALETEIKAEVVTGGATVKGAHFMAVYTKGRVSWDSKKLDGLMILVPQLSEARKEGDPSVSIRKVG